MNETGSYPGQPWLWLYTMWYYLPGFDNSANVDLIAVAMTGLATILLLAVPFIPGLRDIPRLIPIHRLIWRSWNESGGTPGPGTSGQQAARPAGAAPAAALRPARLRPARRRHHRNPIPRHPRTGQRQGGRGRERHGLGRLLRAVMAGR